MQVIILFIYYILFLKNPKELLSGKGGILSAIVNLLRFYDLYFNTFS